MVFIDPAPANRGTKPEAERTAEAEIPARPANSPRAAAAAEAPDAEFARRPGHPAGAAPPAPLRDPPLPPDFAQPRNSVADSAVNSLQASMASPAGLAFAAARLLLGVAMQTGDQNAQIIELRHDIAGCDAEQLKALVDQILKEYTDFREARAHLETLCKDLGLTPKETEQVLDQLDNGGTVDELVKNVMQLHAAHVVDKGAKALSQGPLPRPPSGWQG